jgi:glycosyltransferase involved in cell wall biosynthesis
MFKAANQLKAQLSGLSRRYSGDAIVLATETEYTEFGRIRLFVLGGASKTQAWRQFILSLRLHSESPYSVIVCYDPLKTGLIGLLLSWATRRPLVVGMPGDYADPANYMEGGSRLVLRAKRWLYPRIESFVIRRSQGVHALNPKLAARARGVSGERVVRVIPSIVDLTGFEPGSEEKVILFVGHPFWLKGVDVLIAAFRSISERYPDWQLKILGWFPDKALLDNAIGDHPRIVLHPPVFRTDLPQHVSSCAIFVLPSRAEAMGRVLVEAMACGKPRIGSNVGGIPTVIEHGVDGLLVEPGDVQDLARALESLMVDSDLRRRLGAAGLARAQVQFAEPALSAAEAELYDAVVRAWAMSH